MSHLSLAGSSGSFNEAQNQAEFEAARQAWLRSGEAVAAVAKPPPKKKPSTAAGTDAVSIARKGMTRPKDRAGLLMAETRKMEERLQLLRRTTEAEKEKRLASAAKPSSAAAAGLMTTQRIGGAGALRSVAPRIDTKNTFLTVKETAAREARVAEAARARAAAEEARRAEEEARRLAALRAGGHTLVTYAPSESPQQWVLEREPEEVPFAVAAGLGSRLAPAALPAHSGAAPRKQLTAADMLRAKRNGSATRNAVVTRPAAPGTALGGSAASAAAALRVAAASSAASSAAFSASALSSAAPINRTQFNLSSSPSVGVSSGCGDDGGLMGSGELDEAANAEAFAQARLEFLRSLAPATSSNSGVTTSTETDAAQSSSDDRSSNPAASTGGPALSGDWWAQDDAAASSTAAPGSLLDGPAFDEQDSAEAFKAARAQWMQPNAHATAAVASSPRTVSSSPAAASAASSAAVPCSAKSACYTCYKTVPSAAGAGFVDSLTGKFFCSEPCAAAARAEFRVQCKQCRARIKHAQATSATASEAAAAGAKQEWLCSKCVASSPPASTSTAATAASAASAAPSAAAAPHPQPSPSSSLPDEPVISLFGDDEMIAALQARARDPARAATKSSAATRSSSNSRAASASAVHPRSVGEEAVSADADSISAWES